MDKRAAPGNGPANTSGSEDVVCGTGSLDLSHAAAQATRNSQATRPTPGQTSAGAVIGQTDWLAAWQ